MRDRRLLSRREPRRVVPIEVVVARTDAGVQRRIGIGLDFAALGEVIPRHQLDPVGVSLDRATPRVAKRAAVSSFPIQKVFGAKLLGTDRHHEYLAVSAVYGCRGTLHSS